MTRSVVALLCSAAALSAIASGPLTARSQAATTTTVTGSNPGNPNSFPFGLSDIWPQLIWVYKDVPAFDLKAGDNLAFDLKGQNDVNIQVAIALGATTANGGDVPTAAGFTPIVPNTQLAADPDGNTTGGDYELSYTATAPFSFPGGGLLIRIANPAGPFASDAVDNTVFTDNSFPATDSSGYFVERIAGDPDGVYPWTGATMADYIAGFRLTIQDVPATPDPILTPIAIPAPIPAPVPAKAKCKKKPKKVSASAAKKRCKKKR